MAELGETDNPRALIQGNPEAIDKNVKILNARGKQAVNAAIGLRAIDTGAWTGPAANAFRDEFSYEPTKWYEAGDSLTYAGEVLGLYAGTLRWAQGQAREAIELWKQAQQQTAKAQANHDQAVADATRQNQANAAAGNPTCITVEPFSDPGESTRQAARDTLNRARHQLKQVADDTAQALRSITPAEEETTLSKMGHGALDLAGLIPGIGELADGTNAAWYAGQGRYTEAAISGAAAVPFAGWAATAGKAADKATDIAKAAGHAPAKFGHATHTNYRKTFFEKHPDLEGKVVVHHAVEQKALKQYPDNGITAAEMHSYENLRGIPKESNSRLHLSEIRKDWNDFYEKHPNATTEELLDFATHIDNKYGHEFNPPVR
ncbi:MULTISPECIES: putative T7SS-secreted protein [Prauserella salsuginis group]|uniref:T7SS-secreted protein n=1 Tax=Prauserella salsuginis TaxID=387889 RepID=A0ABW6G053_9PSEU|nr:MULTISPECIES: hypothetical protein [Prauserella salsuginis group]MCR3721190.1 hypothetical protein [Prauserella flava]MCR3734729.1 hypothetical protein [Prauserella salsuginis]